MLKGQQNGEGHDKFKELSALAGTGTLTPSEVSELNGHLEDCEECREVAFQYLLLKTQGIPTLAAAYNEWQEQSAWNEAPTRQKLLDRVGAEQRHGFEPSSDPAVPGQSLFLRRIAVMPFARVLLAACLVMMVGLGAYHLGLRAPGHSRAAAGMTNFWPGFLPGFLFVVGCSTGTAAGTVVAPGFFIACFCWAVATSGWSMPNRRCPAVWPRWCSP